MLNIFNKYLKVESLQYFLANMRAICLHSDHKQDNQSGKDHIVGDVGSLALAARIRGEE